MNKKTLSLSLGSVIAASISLAPVVQASENPFAMKEIPTSTRVAEAGDKMKDGKCGEGKCGGKMKPEPPAAKAQGKTKEGNCGAKKMKDGGCNGSMKPEESTPATQQ